MLARSDTGQIIARAEFTETVERDEVTMRLTYRFADGSIDDETTTYRQHGAFQLIRNHHIQQGPFFLKPVDFAEMCIRDRSCCIFSRNLSHR